MYEIGSRYRIPSFREIHTGSLCLISWNENRSRVSTIRFSSSATLLFFVAYSGGAPVGRISAQINRRYLEQHGDRTGHFGFFDCIDDQNVAAALIKTAAKWLKDRDLHRMAGPFNLTINEESGLLVSGFDTPPAILTRHSRPWVGPTSRGQWAAEVDGPPCLPHEADQFAAGP